ncbi:MAG: hypothetical protein AVDCRST_MAG69-1565 [uncultured Solirubrobacteraceae bacterium]|uniref:Helix-turn-helix domain-containing protein n=1 Tax=uncultured Solirubrobacteraceae bacterium TaxID=1162706 RepID=A0A6J4SIV2_9ACTN|nr:MAG: hypothetical protein AVDCRST_MAG69-1565 [uncultured Solirubrobacteraceae bacterium]
MADIGEVLRETRMRKRVDMSEVEASTKIRAKYLRALENEEWDMLPGPTFVKTFLRTYAEYLELDARSLVEEYKQRYERPSSGELTPFAPMRRGNRGRRRRRLGPWIALLLVLVAIAAGLWFLGRDAADPGVGTGGPESSSPAREGADADEERVVDMRITATRRVRVCVLDARNREVVDGRRLGRGDSTRRLTGESFRVGFAGGTASMRVGDRRYDVSARTRRVGYELRAGEPPRRLPRGRVPDCR